MKALSDRVKTLENEKMFLEEKVQIIEMQSKDNLHKLSTKLKEESERHSL